MGLMNGKKLSLLPLFSSHLSLLSECCAGGPGSYLCLKLQQRLLWFCVQGAHRNGLGGAGCSQGPLGPHCHPFHYVCRAIAMYMRVLCLSHPPFPCFALRRVKVYLVDVSKDTNIPRICCVFFVFPKKQMCTKGVMYHSINNNITNQSIPSTRTEFKMHLPLNKYQTFKNIGAQAESDAGHPPTSALQ